MYCRCIIDMDYKDIVCQQLIFCNELSTLAICVHYMFKQCEGKTVV